MQIRTSGCELRRLLGNRHAENGWSMLTHHCRFNRFQFLHRNWLAKISSSSVCLSILSCQYWNWFPRQKNATWDFAKNCSRLQFVSQKIKFCWNSMHPAEMATAVADEADERLRCGCRAWESIQSFLSGIHKNPHAECCRVLPCRGKEIFFQNLYIFTRIPISGSICIIDICTICTTIYVHAGLDKFECISPRHMPWTHHLENRSPERITVDGEALMQ